MDLTIARRWKTARSTIGVLTVDGNYECYTLEPHERPEGDKVYGQTAIPLGTYQVTIDNSLRFGRLLPHILGVPGFEGIRIHPGNTDHDTEGCILVGETKDADFIGNSKVAFEKLFQKLQAASNKAEKITLTIQEVV